MSRDDYDARKVQESRVVPPVILVSCEQTPEVAEPRKQPLDLPSASIPPQWPAVLSLLSFPAIGCDHLDARLQQRYVKPVTVICFVASQPVRQCPCPPRVQRRFDKSDFTWGSAFRVDGERTTSSVCNRHDPGPFLTLRGTDQSPPFRAATNVPSMKRSDRSTPPRSCKSRINAFITDSSTPAFTQDWKRRCRWPGMGTAPVSPSKEHRSGGSTESRSTPTDRQPRDAHDHLLSSVTPVGAAPQQPTARMSSPSVSSATLFL